MELSISFTPYNLELMARTAIDWESRVGRRLALRNLYVFFTVVQRGSMAKAARELSVTQPAVSKVIADLEHTLGVRLLDRRPQGVEPTVYGRALLKRSNAAFDELKQSIRDIEHLADPTLGEVRFGCQESIAAAILPPIMQRFSLKYPRVALRMEQLGLTLELPALRERILDFAVLRLSRPLSGDDIGDELNAEILFRDRLVVAAGKHHRFARRRKVELADLLAEPWILSGPDTWNYTEVAQAFRSRDLDMPKISLETYSTILRASLLATGPYIATFPSSVLRLYAERFSLQALPVDLPVQPWPVVIVTLKNRTLSPVVERFIEFIREFAKSIGDRERVGAR
jgi:DNA-binding transcriptional LysR family regulator